MVLANFERQIRPIVVAHRGASAHHSENTLVSFQAAIDAGADVVELDARLTADGQAVILHDLDLSATTNGSGFVHTRTLAEVKRLDASGGRGPTVAVPTLREALELLSGRAGINVEIKNLPGEPAFDSPKEAIAEAVVSLLRETSFEGLVLVSSFNWLSIERIRHLDPGIPTGFLCTAAIDPWAALVYVKSQGHAFLLPQAPALFEAGQEFVRAAHDEGVQVGTWTVDDPEAIQRLFEMGVDAIATNDPALAVPIRDRFRQGP